MHLKLDSDRTLMGPRGARIRTGTVDGDAYAVTAPTVESGQRRPNRVPNARFAEIADWIPLELFSTEFAARRAFGRHVRGRCRVTMWGLLPTRVLLLLSEDDLAYFNSSWSAFEDLDEPDSREITEFVRCSIGLDGLVTRALVAQSAYHVVLTGDPFRVAVRLGAALHPTLPDPSRRR
jgi:hypothetical protein